MDRPQTSGRELDPLKSEARGSHSIERTFDAKLDAESYLKNHLGPSPRAVNLAPTLILLAFAILPAVFFVQGILMYGPPPILASVLVPFLAPIFVFGGGAIYLFWTGLKKPAALPDSYGVNANGINIYRTGRPHEFIDWENPRLFFQLLDRRPWSTLTLGVTQMGWRGGTMPIPAEMFDLLLGEARTKGLAGPPKSYLAARGGRVTRVTVAASPQFRGR